MLDYIRIVCAVPTVTVGDVDRNVQAICGEMAGADENSADILLLPELCMTGYSCADLFLQDVLWQKTAQGLKKLLEESGRYPSLCIIAGAPIRINGKLLNCAVAMKNGAILGIVPKTYLSGEENRWFLPGDVLTEKTADLGELGIVPCGTDLLFQLADGAVLGIEICEDMNAPVPPSSLLALNGANVIVNLSASDALVGKAEQRECLAVHQSGVLHCVYAYCSAGYSESTSDKVYSGYTLVTENGVLLRSGGWNPRDGYGIVVDCDLGRVNADRRKDLTFQKAGSQFQTGEYVRIPAEKNTALRSDGSLYPLRKLVFVPEEAEQRRKHCLELYQIQVTGLMRRLETISAKAVIGISGGLDSTLALLVSVEAMKRLGRPLTDVHGITMPCFGTSDRTYGNAWALMEGLGITAKEIPIVDVVKQHFRAIGHDDAVRDATFENAQARERTQVLMDYAGRVGGIVVGTGDMSELALGWCTYNGDHMSMYGVNADVPKTLIPHILQTLAAQPAYEPVGKILMDIVDTPISPELLPPDRQGEIAQQTEEIVGPYPLHDFFLYHMLRYGFAPQKLYTMACRAFVGDYDGAVVKKWLGVFYRRFFSQQFKRNCLPDGVKVGSVGLSPRGDWRMPSDMTGRLWLEETEKL